MVAPLPTLHCNIASIHWFTCYLPDLTFPLPRSIRVSTFHNSPPVCSQPRQKAGITPPTSTQIAGRRTTWQCAPPVRHLMHVWAAQRHNRWQGWRRRPGLVYFVHSLGRGEGVLARGGRAQAFGPRPGQRAPGHRGEQACPRQAPWPAAGGRSCELAASCWRDHPLHGNGSLPAQLHAAGPRARQAEDKRTAAGVGPSMDSMSEYGRVSPSMGVQAINSNSPLLPPPFHFRWCLPPHQRSHAEVHLPLCAPPRRRGLRHGRGHRFPGESRPWETGCLGISWGWWGGWQPGPAPPHWRIMAEISHTLRSAWSAPDSSPVTAV